MLKGELVNLRAVEPQDVDNWYNWFNDPGVTQYLARVYPYSKAQAEAYYKRVSDNSGDLVYSVLTKDGLHIGSVGLHKIDWRSRHAEMSVVVGVKQFWGKGMGQDAVRTLAKFAFAEMGLNRVYLYVHGGHSGGQKAYERVGFTVEGTLRQHLYRDGKFHDLILMGLFQDELR